METTKQELKWVGKDIKRREDPALITGKATYTNDMTLPGMLYAAVLRSPHAHARILSIEKTAAEELPGVYTVLTGEEATELINPVPCFAAEPVEERAIAVDKVRYAGEAVVAVAAESRYVAEDALELVEIEWEPLEHVVDAEEAMKPDAPLLARHARLEPRLRPDLYIWRRRGGLRAGRPRDPSPAALAAGRARTDGAEWGSV